MSLNCDITVVPGRHVADLLAAGADDLGGCTIADGLSGLTVAAADLGDSLVLVSTLQLAGGVPGLASALDAPVYQAVIGETGDGFAFMAVTDAGARTRAFNGGVEVHTEGEPLAVEGALSDLDTDALTGILARVETTFALDDALLDTPSTSVEVGALLGF